MSNTIGNHLRLTTFGESHGAAVGGILDGCPAGIAVDEQLIANEMERRHDGGYATSRREPDVVEILSGTYQGTLAARTTASWPAFTVPATPTLPTTVATVCATLAAADGRRGARQRREWRQEPLPR